MHRVQASACDPPLDGSPAETDREQLAARHHPVLPLSELRHGPPKITSATFATYFVGNAAFAGHGPEIGPKGGASVRRFQRLRVEGGSYPL
jgi:hypothetical protein